VLEFIVAFSTRSRRKALSREAFNAVVSHFLKDVLDRFAIMSVNDELIASAAPLAVKHALPSSDCLQLASVFSLKKALEPAKEKLILVCSDKDLCRAAEEEGIELIDPEVLSRSYLPEKLLHRDKERAELTNNLKNFINTFICGPCVQEKQL